MRSAALAALVLLTGCDIYFGEDDVADDVPPPWPDAGWWDVDAEQQPDASFPSCDQSLTCPAAQEGRVNICGWLVDLENGSRLEASSTDGVCVEASQAGACALDIAFYDALEFANDPINAQQQPYDELYVDECGRFRAIGVVRPALGFLAIGVDDDPTVLDAHRLTGVAFAVTSGQTRYELVPSMRRQTDTLWTSTAGLTGETIVDRGAMLITYRDAAGNPVAGVSATREGNPVSAYYFSDTQALRKSTINPAFTATGANGSAVVLGSALVNHSGTGAVPAGCSAWSTSLGASIPGALLVTERRPVCP